MTEFVIKTGDGEELEFESKKEMMIQMGKHFLQRTETAMTLRQLYYQFVGADLIDNKQSQYQYLGKAMKEARLQGRISWDAIEDRNRETIGGDIDYVSPEKRLQSRIQRIKSIPENYARPRWENQDHYIEVWVEKEALASVFENVCNPLGVKVFPCKGYPSVTMLHQASWRFKKELRSRVQNSETSVTRDNRISKYAHVLYFGDFDPSGKDIERSIREGMAEKFDIPVSVERQALTKQQIDKFELPPQPAKSSDARYEDFVKTHGDMAVELDALDPEELKDLIRESVESYFDEETYSEVKEKEEKEIEEIKPKIDSIMDQIEE